MRTSEVSILIIFNIVSLVDVVFIFCFCVTLMGSAPISAAIKYPSPRVNVGFGFGGYLLEEVSS